MRSWHAATTAECRIGLYQDQGAVSGRASREIRRLGESASTNGLPGPDHAHLAASSQRFMGGHNLTELRTDLARVTFLLDHDEGLFGTDPLS
jgi:hypothetical protein